MVKANWDTEELIENWTFLPQELELVNSKVGANQIGLAVLLKYFQIYARFPNSPQEIPETIISYIAQQLQIPDRFYSDYDWQGRSISNHRASIRKLFGFRTVTIADGEEMVDWLKAEIIPNEQRIEPITELVYQRWRELQIEPPTPGRVERLIRSAIAQHEADFCQQTLDKLTPEIIEQIDILLSTEETEELENAQSEKRSIGKIKMSDLAFLKTDPGAVGLGSFLTEIEKLRRIRAVGLPTNLFEGRSPKLVKTYRQRAATETPYLLRQHQDAIRYTLMAAFCIQRSQEITDNLIEILIQIIHRLDSRASKRINQQLIDEQNLITQYHLRYGGRGVMIYWHVEKNSTCIYSQLKTCSSSEVAAMINGVLKHCTSMEVQKNYVDSHGQSEVAFAFTHLLGFQLMPRLKRIKVQKLYRPHAGQADAYSNLQPILTRPINWDLIRQQYDQMVKYATALRLGTAETEAILKRFSKNPFKHPTYLALMELGRVIKTIFLCQYLDSEAVRREINEGLNVVERWNGVNDFIFYGKGGEFADNRLESQELSVLSLHLLQICLVYVNTLMIQEEITLPLREVEQ